MIFSMILSRLQIRLSEVFTVMCPGADMRGVHSFDPRVPTRFSGPPGIRDLSLQKGLIQRSQNFRDPL